MTLKLEDFEPVAEIGQHGFNWTERGFNTDTPYGTKFYTASHMQQLIDLCNAQDEQFWELSNEIIELKKQLSAAQADNARLRDVMASLYKFASRNICSHDETHRGGCIWEICDMCGQKWADDEGGKPEFKWPAEILLAEAALTTNSPDDALKEYGAKLVDRIISYMKKLDANATLVSGVQEFGSMLVNGELK